MSSDGRDEFDTGDGSSEQTLSGALLLACIAVTVAVMAAAGYFFYGGQPQPQPAAQKVAEGHAAPEVRRVARFISAEDEPANAFLGEWTGKWDNTWFVRFTISKSGSDIAVVYEWEENVGRPHQRQFRTGTLLNGMLRVGSGIDIQVSPNHPDRATAFGHFKNPRTAALTRVKAAQ